MGGEPELRECVICHQLITDYLNEVRIDYVEGIELRGWVHATCFDTYMDAVDGAASN